MISTFLNFVILGLYYFKSTIWNRKGANSETLSSLPSLSDEPFLQRNILDFQFSNIKSSQLLKFCKRILHVLTEIQSRFGWIHHSLYLVAGPVVCILQAHRNRPGCIHLATRESWNVEVIKGGSYFVLLNFAITYLCDVLFYCIHGRFKFVWIWFFLDSLVFQINGLWWNLLCSF